MPTNPSVIYPTYGLAEHTVFVCSGGRGKLTVKRRELEEENKVVIVEEGETAEEITSRLLGCGFPSAQNVDVCIVDPERSTVLEEDHVGEIWINSPSKAIGYFRKDDITQSEFHAALAADRRQSNGSNASDGYLRSGDLGFLHDGELYVCGRLKDLIIVGGRNYYPQDLEATAESSSDSIRPGCSAAFSISGSSEGEDVVLILELKDPLPKAKQLQSTCEGIISTVRSAISKEFSLFLACIVVLKARSVPKTTSGKISRSRAKKAFLSGDLNEVYISDFKGRADSAAPTNSSTTNTPDEDNKIQSTITTTSPVVPPSDARSLDRKDIRELLLTAICQIANIDKSLVTDTSPLNTFMDSVSLAQLKGMLEGQYRVKTLSDEYLFRDTTTLNKLVEVVKIGEAQDDGNAASGGAAAAQSTHTSTGSGGIAGALGCPPGVVCCTIM